MGLVYVLTCIKKLLVSAAMFLFVIVNHDGCNICLVTCVMLLYAGILLKIFTDLVLHRVSVVWF